MLPRSLVVAVALGAACSGEQPPPAPPASDPLEESKRACGQGKGPHCLEAGRRYQVGETVEIDLAEALRYYELGCAASDAASCHMAGQAYLIGAGATRDVARAIPLLTKACDGGSAHGCFKLGGAYSGRPPFGGSVVDEAAAFRYLVKSCDLDDLAGCSSAGSAAETGRHGGPPDSGKAAGFYQKGCAMPDGSGVPESVTSTGQATACWRLANLYRTGRVNGPRDTAEALTRLAKDYLSRQCTAGWPMECFGLGTMESSEEDPTGDLDRALAAFDRACALGVAPACEQARELAPPEE